MVINSFCLLYCVLGYNESISSHVVISIFSKMTFSSVRIEHGVHGHKGDYVTRGRHVLVLDDADDAHV